MPARKTPLPVPHRTGRGTAGRAAVETRSKPRIGAASKSAASGRLGGPIAPAVTARAQTAPEAVDAATLAEIFRRFHAAEPEPKGELHYVNPFTLLVQKKQIIVA